MFVLYHQLYSNTRLSLSFIQKQISSCEKCTSALLRDIYPDDADDGTEDGPVVDSSSKSLVSKILAKDDQEEQIRNLEEELIKTKVALAEEKNRADEIDLKLQNYISNADKPWYKKVVNTNKR